jgi:hypothetical protein
MELGTRLAIAFTADGSGLILITDDTISIHDAATGELQYQVAEMRPDTSMMLMRQDGKVLITTGYHGLIELWGVPAE